MSERIEFDELPARLRLLAEQMEAVGAAVRYYGGVGPLDEFGSMLEQSSPIFRELAGEMERLRGGRA